MKTKIGVYAGSFNPFHVGHQNIVEQASELFDEVIIAQGWNPDKPKSNDSLPTSISNKYRIRVYCGLLANLLNEISFESDQEVFLIRGLRNGEDLAYEDNQLRYIKDMYPSVKPVFFRCDPQFDHVSSSGIRALKNFSDSGYERYLPK